MMENIDEKSSNFSPRPYQLEIFDEALSKNVIVCLGTGTGKTFISVMLIKQLSHQIKGNLQDDGQRTFFLVNTVPLVNQQSKAIETHTNLTVGKYSGDMGVDFWDKSRWQKEFNDNDVIVMTAQILYNMLQHGFIKLSNINLLLLDECHHASGNHPYAKIMEMLPNCEKQPKVMGLTASIINKKPERNVNLHSHLENSMRDLECMMRSVCVTCVDPNATAKFATKPIEKVEVYPPTRFDLWPELAELDEAIGEQLYSADEFLTSLKSSDKSNVKEVFIQSIKELVEIRDALGLWCTYNATKIIRKNLASHQETCIDKHDSLLIKMMITKVAFIEEMFKNFAVQTYGSVDQLLLSEPIITGKAMSLMDSLRERKHGLCAIIFVQRRVTSKVLSSLINNITLRFRKEYEGIKSDYVYGHNIEEVLKGGNMTSRNQEKVLQNFRNGAFNVLVSTSVVEEGVDVRKCNLVVKFDGISNYREYVQSKGRARAVNSSYVVFSNMASAQDTRRDLETFREIEKILNKKSHEREEPTEEEIEERNCGEELIKPFQVSNEEGAPKITKDNAIQLLHMYCSKLPSDRFTVCKPVCQIVRDDYNEFTGTVRLPMNCPLKDVIQGDSMPTKRLAKMSAAQEACIQLYQSCELDENFLPWKESVFSENSEDDEGQEIETGAAKPGTKKARKAYPRKIPDCFNSESKFPTTGLYLYGLKVVLAKPREDATVGPLWKIWYSEERREFGLFTAKELPKIPSFPLFNKAGELRVDIELIVSHVKLTSSQFKSISGFHERFFREFASAFTQNREFSRSMAKNKALLAPIFNEMQGMLSNHNRYQIDIGSPIGDYVDFDFISQLTNPDSDLSLDASVYEDAVIKRTYMKNDTPFYVVDVRYDMKITDKIAKDKPTFKDYYRQKYGKNIHENQPLLHSVTAEKRINNITPRYGKEVVKSSTSKLVYLIPELCTRRAMPASFHCQALCIPSLLFRLETILLAEELRNSLSELTINNAKKRRKVTSQLPDESIEEIYRQKKQPSDRGSGLPLSNIEGFFSNSQQISTSELKIAVDNLQNALSGVNKVKINNIQLGDILQCLTTTKANAGFDLERLETLGDAFLKLATSIALYFHHPTANEGRLTEKRKHLISNKTLAKAAKKMQLESIIVNTAFGIKQTGKEEDVIYELARAHWIPPMFAEVSERERGFQQPPYQVIADKSLADCIEALTGAFYSYGGVKCGLKFLQWLGIRCLCENESPQRNSKYADFPTPQTALLPTENSDRHLHMFYKSNKCHVLEERIGYRFKDKSFLIQAITHMSYDKNTATDCYQRLEFLGDSILDFLVISYLYENYTDMDPSSLTDIKSALVNNNTFSLLSIKNKLHKSLMHASPSLLVAISQFVQQTENGSNTVESLLRKPFIIVFNEEDKQQEGYCAPKVLGDIFESLAGAVFLDSDLDLVCVWKVFFPILKPLIDAYVENVPINPVRKLHESFPKASNSCKQLDNGKMKCTWTVNGEEYEGTGQNSVMAKAAAAQSALRKLKI